MGGWGWAKKWPTIWQVVTKCLGRIPCFKSKAVGIFQPSVGLIGSIFLTQWSRLATISILTIISFWPEFGSRQLCHLLVCCTPCTKVSMVDIGSTLIGIASLCRPTANKVVAFPTFGNTQLFYGFLTSLYGILFALTCMNTMLLIFFLLIKMHV